jgi:uncharacterized protein YecE (DUF72 family)
LGKVLDTARRVGYAEPVVKPRVLIGTSGYSYDDWVGPVYPPGTDKRDFLARYAAQFPIVELNFTYYAQPTARTLSRMVELTPEGFLFSVKAHRTMTHEIAETWEKDTAAFREGVRPLAESGRLAAVLLQFPYRFGYTRESRSRLAALCDLLQGLPLAVEFRKSDWLRDSVYEGLRERGAALVSVDEPELPKLLRPSTMVTGDFAYVRLHGRNRAAWWTGDNVSRYDYLYTRAELEEWAERIRAVLERARWLMVFFNNHPSGQAARNAVELRDVLRERGLLE